MIFSCRILHLSSIHSPLLSLSPQTALGLPTAMKEVHRTSWKCSVCPHTLCKSQRWLFSHERQALPPALPYKASLQGTAQLAMLAKIQTEKRELPPKLPSYHSVCLLNLSCSTHLYLLTGQPWTYLPFLWILEGVDCNPLLGKKWPRLTQRQGA